MRLRCTAIILGLLVLPSTFSGAQSQDIASVVEELTLQEKACLITGMNKWETCAVPRSGIPAVWMADGPVGLRKNLGTALTDSVPATCFPSAAAMAATWNPALIERVGAGGGGSNARGKHEPLIGNPGRMGSRKQIYGPESESQISAIPS